MRRNEARKRKSALANALEKPFAINVEFRGS